MKDIRATRRQFSAEKKIRIVPEGLRGEEEHRRVCRREGIGLVLDKPVASETTLHEIDFERSRYACHGL